MMQFLDCMAIVARGTKERTASGFEALLLFASFLVAWMQGPNVVRATDKGDAAALRHHDRTFLGAVVLGFMGHEASTIVSDWRSV